MTLQVENTPTVMADDEEAVQQVEGNRGEGEEVHSGDDFKNPARILARDTSSEVPSLCASLEDRRNPKKASSTRRC